MADTNNGGPAFPKLTSGHVEESRGSGHDNMRFVSTDGMSLRDWFAGKALQGICAGTMSNDRFDMLRDGVAGGKHEATVAYALADAMLKARG